MGTPIMHIKMAKAEDFKKWENGNLYLVDMYSSGNTEFITREEAIRRTEEDSKKYGDNSSFEQLFKEWQDNGYGSEDDFFKEGEFYSYQKFFSNDEFFAFNEDVVCEHGTPYIIFGYTGW